MSASIASSSACPHRCESVVAVCLFVTCAAWILQTVHGHSGGFDDCKDSGDEISVIEYERVWPADEPSLLLATGLPVVSVQFLPACVVHAHVRSLLCNRRRNRKSRRKARHCASLASNSCPSMSNILCGQSIVFTT
jgi:hypothetical protein